MKLSIQTPGVELSDRLLESIRRSVEEALDRFAGAVREIRVTLRATNGPKGGADKRCVIRLHLMPRGILVVSEEGSRFQQTVEAAAERVSSALAKNLESRAAARKRRGSQGSMHSIEEVS